MEKSIVIDMPRSYNVGTALFLHTVVKDKELNVLRAKITEIGHKVEALGKQGLWQLKDRLFIAVRVYYR